MQEKETVSVGQELGAEKGAPPPARELHHAVCGVQEPDIRYTRVVDEKEVLVAGLERNCGPPQMGLVRMPFPFGSKEFHRTARKTARSKATLNEETCPARRRSRSDAAP